MTASQRLDRRSTRRARQAACKDPVASSAAENLSSIECHLAAPPVDGAANAELIVVVASALGIPRKKVKLVTGAGSRVKVLEVRGLPEAEVAGRLAAAVGR